MVLVSECRESDRDEVSDEDFHHLAVGFLLGEGGRRGAWWLGVYLHGEPPF